MILAKDNRTFSIEAPLISVVEAKKNDLELGVYQCAAQMLGVQAYNKRYGKEVPVIFGCVTTADNWQFLKLEDKQFTIDENRYYISDIEEVMGAFQGIIDYYLESLG